MFLKSAFSRWELRTAIIPSFSTHSNHEWCPHTNGEGSKHNSFGANVDFRVTLRDEQKVNNSECREDFGPSRGRCLGSSCTLGKVSLRISGDVSLDNVHRLEAHGKHAIDISVRCCTFVIPRSYKSTPLLPQLAQRCFFVVVLVQDLRRGKIKIFLRDVNPSLSQCVHTSLCADALQLSS